MSNSSDLLEVLTQIVLPVVVVGGGVLVFWALPVYLGIRWARQRGYSPLWMLFGLHPMGAWIAAAVIQVCPQRVRCSGCHQFIRADYTICPYCRCDQLEFDPEDPADSRYPT